MTLIKYFSIILGLSFIASCSGDPEDFFSPIVEINLPPHKSKLVVFANFQAGSDSLIVHLTRSRSALSTAKVGTVLFDTTRLPMGGFYVTQYDIDFDSLKNAKVELFRNEALWGTFKMNKLGKYLLQQKLPNDGANYRLRAEVAGFETVEATQNMPTAGILDSVRFVRNGAVVQDPFGGGSEKQDEFTYVLKDPIETGNYYKVQAAFFSKNTTFFYTLSQKSLDPLTQSEFLSDKSFNGKTYSWRNYGKDYNLQEPGSRMEYTLFTSTVDLLRFVRSKELNDDARDNPFAEPVILYSNVKNGYGIFTLTASSTWIKKY